jgi:hypothetical protein
MLEARQGSKSISDVRQRFNGILRDTITERLSSIDYKRAYVPDKDNIKTVIKFQN